MSEKDGAREMLILSIAGAVMVSAMAWLGVSVHADMQPLDRLIVDVPLLVSFSLGISLAVRPGWMRRHRKGDIHADDVGLGRIPGRTRRGHHPDCEHFKPHTVEVGGDLLCAGCTGLALGSVVSIGLVGFFIFMQMDTPMTVSLLMVVAGTSLAVASMLHSELFNPRGYARLAGNVVMPVGFFFVATGLLETTGEAAFGLAGVLISCLWLDTRIRLSRRRHIRICRDCGEACKSYLG